MASAQAGGASSGSSAPVGIINAIPLEQAPILARMHVTSKVVVSGYTFYKGTIDGHPVVDSASGQGLPDAVLDTWLMDTRFHPRATEFIGTAGTDNSGVNVGDVVVSAYVLDKEQLHYYDPTGGDGTHQGPYSGDEVQVTGDSDTAGAVINSYGNVYPTPADAAGFNNKPDPTDKNQIFVSALAATDQLVTTAENAPVGTTSLADATGDPSDKGTVTNKVIVGAIGASNVWTEPLVDIEAQNMVFQNDAEENEGLGVAFANAQTGTPWVVISDISDGPWFPAAYDGNLASDHGAAVASYLVDHLPATVSKAPATMSTLSPVSNARRAGYLIADQANYSQTPVSKVVYTNGNGKKVTLTGAALKKLENEYQPSAAKP